MFVSYILFNLCGNVLIPEDQKYFSQFCCFLQQNCGLGLEFEFGLSVGPVLYCLAPQRLILKTQSKIQFLGPFSGHRKMPV